MAGINPWLAGILGGVGGFGMQAGAAIEEENRQRAARAALEQAATLKREELAQQQRQFDTTQADKFVQPSDVALLFSQLGMTPPPEMMGPARINAGILPTLLTQASEQQKLAQQRANDVKTQALLEQAKGQPAIIPPLERAETEVGQVAEPPMSREDLAAGLAGLGHKDAGLTTLINMLRPQKQVLPLPENAPGLYNPETGAVTRFDRPTGGRPEPRPGFEVEVTTDRHGNQSYHEKRITSGVDHDALARERGFGSFAQAPTDVQHAINAQIKQDRVDVSNAQGAGALAMRPYTDVEQTAFAAHNNILTSIAQLKQFSPEEIAAYTGLVNRPVANLKNALAGTGIIDADKRFNEFKPIMGRLQGTAFGEGGKQLTGIELMVVQQYTPTGQELGGAPEVMAKVRNLEAFTKMSRESRMYLAKTGRGAVDADQLDTMLRDKMAQAGMPIPQPHPGWNAAPGAAPKLGEPGYTGRVTQPDMPQTPAGPGKVWIRAPDGVWGKWDARQPIPQGYMR